MLKLRSNNSGNDEEISKIMGQTRKLERNKNVASKIIFDEVLLYRHTEEHNISHLITALYFLKHPHAAINMKNCKWFQYGCEFLGMEMEAGVTQPKQLKIMHFPR